MTLNPQERHARIDQQRTKHCEMALEALRNVLRANPGVEIQCIGHFKLLFSLLRCEGCENLQRLALEVMCCVAGCQECVADIAASNVVSYLLMTLISLETARNLSLEVLFPLTSSTKLLKEAMNKGALIYLLHLFCSASNAEVRIQTAGLFAKVLSDKLVGPRLRLLLAKFLPPVFLDAMRDNSEASVHMFESVHENPELIWNEEGREKVCGVVERMCLKHYRSQRENPDTKWNLPEDFSVIYAQSQGEIVIGGVFLRLFVANPGWVLRKPREFLTELLEKWASLVENSVNRGEMLETITEALSALFTAQPTMLDTLPQLGVLPKFFKAMRSKDTAVVKHSVVVVQRVTASSTCVQSISQIECIGAMKEAMTKRPDIIGMALKKIFYFCNI